MTKISLILTIVCGLLGLVLLVMVWFPYEPAQAQISGDMRAHFTAMVQTCRADFARLCGGIRPGRGRILSCLKSQTQPLSPACALGIAEFQALKNQAIRTGPLPK